jgi:hypothetical protein
MSRIFYIGLCSVIVLIAIGVGISAAANTNGGYQTITQTAVLTDNGEYQIIGQTTTVPTEFNGPTYTSDLGGGSGLEVALSSPSVEVGGTLRMRVKLTGPAAWSNSGVELIVTNYNGEKVYDVVYIHTHITLRPEESPPQEDDVYDLGWEAKSSDTAGNVEVTPGAYSFIIAPYGLEENMCVRGTIEVKIGSGSTSATSNPPIAHTTTITTSIGGV